MLLTIRLGTGITKPLEIIVNILFFECVFSFGYLPRHYLSDLTFLGPGLSAVSGVLLLAWSNFPVYSLVISEAGRPLGIDLGLAGGLALATPWVKNKSIKGLLLTAPRTSRLVTGQMGQVRVLPGFEVSC